MRLFEPNRSLRCEIWGAEGSQRYCYIERVSLQVSAGFPGCNFKILYVICLEKSVSVKSTKVALEILYKTFRVNYHKMFSFTKIK